MSVDVKPKLSDRLRWLQFRITEKDRARYGVQQGGDCPSCGNQTHVEVPIHGGRSLRRDCARCGTFLEFAQWKNSN